MRIFSIIAISSGAVAATLKNMVRIKENLTAALVRAMDPFFRIFLRGSGRHQSGLVKIVYNEP